MVKFCVRERINESIFSFCQRIFVRNFNFFYFYVHKDKWQNKMKMEKKYIKRRQQRQHCHPFVLCSHCVRHIAIRFPRFVFLFSSAFFMQENGIQLLLITARDIIIFMSFQLLISSRQSNNWNVIDEREIKQNAKRNFSINFISSHYCRPFCIFIPYFGVSLFVIAIFGSLFRGFWPLNYFRRRAIAMIADIIRQKLLMFLFMQNHLIFAKKNSFFFKPELKCFLSKVMLIRDHFSNEKK